MSFLNKIKALFEAEQVTEQNVENFKDYKSGDLIIRIEGDIASIISEDGSISPAPAGEHKLDDGSTIVVAEEGKIIEKKEAEKGQNSTEEQMAEPVITDAPSQEAPVETEAPEVEVEMPSEKIVALEAKVAELEAAVSMIAEHMKGMMESNPAKESEMSEIKKENLQLMKKIEELSETPATPIPASFKKVESFNSNVSENYSKNNLNAFTSVIAKLRAEAGE